MKQFNIFSKNNIVRDTFKEVSEFMDTPDFEDQIRELVKSMKIPEVFQMNSDILGVKKEESTKGENIFSEKSWLNLVDFLKVQLKLYEESNNKQSVQDYIKETIDSHCYFLAGSSGNNFISPKNNNVSNLNYLVLDLNKITISYDIKQKNLVMLYLDRKLHFYEDNRFFYQNDLYESSNEPNLNLLRLLKLQYFEGFYDIYKKLDNNLYLNFLKYAVGLEDETWLSSFIISEIKGNFNAVIDSWADESLRFGSKTFNLELFPYNFYKDGNFEIERDIYSEAEITDFVSRKTFNNNFVPVNKLSDYYKNLLTSILNKDYDSILPPEEEDGDFDKFTRWGRLEDPVSVWAEMVNSSKLSELDIKKLREELSPLLDKVFENLIFKDVSTVPDYYAIRRNTEGLYPYFHLNILSDLLYHLKWSPSKFKIGKVVFRNNSFLRTLEELSFVKYLEKLDGVDIEISVILDEDVAEYYADKIPELEKLVKYRLGSKAKLVTPDSPEYASERKSIDVSGLFPKYRIQRI